MPRKSASRSGSDPSRCSLCGRPLVPSESYSIPGGERLCHECLNRTELTLLNELAALGEADPELGTLAAAALGMAEGDLADRPASGAAGRRGAAKKEADASRPVPSPREIKAELDQYVIGQDEAKKVLSVAVHNHYKRIFGRDAGAKEDPELSDVEVEKSNILLVGPTGSGKTLLARTLARLLDVPFAIADATTLTEAGYVGEDVENILLNLIQAAGMDVQKAEKGIVFVDEIDKIARKTGNVSITRDVSGEGVQQALLKIVEGTTARVPPAGGRKHPEQKYIEIRTQDILFICGGAFVGLEDVMRRRSANRHFGFASSSLGAPDAPGGRKDAELRPEPEDFVEFGLIPEFIGRLPVVTTLAELTEDDLVRVLSEPRNALLKQFRKTFRREGVDLSFEPGAIRLLAREALARKTGARGLRAILEEIMSDLMFEVGTSSSATPADFRPLVLTEDIVRRQLAGENAVFASFRS